jgi:hypothetical protein
MSLMPDSTLLKAENTSSPVTGCPAGRGVGPSCIEPVAYTIQDSVCRIQACRLGDDNGERLALEDHGNVQGPLDGPAPVAKPLWSTSAGCGLGWEQACVKTSQSESDDVVLDAMRGHTWTLALG